MSDEIHSPSGGGEPGIGETLRRARIQRGLGLEEVEQATKIRQRYLDGLEREDYDMLPAAVYVQGFLKTYANYLGLDGEEISNEFKRSRSPQSPLPAGYTVPEESEFDRPLLEPGGVVGTRRRGISRGTIATATVALLVLFLVVGSLYFIGRGSQQPPEAGSRQVEPAAQRGQAGGGEQASTDEEPSPGSAETTQESIQETTGEATLEPPESTGESVPETTSEADPDPAPSNVLRAEIRIGARPSWLEIRADGETTYARIAEPGFSETFEARRKLRLNVGDAGAVSVSVNGQDIGILGESGEVLTRKWTLKQESR